MESDRGLHIELCILKKDYINYRKESIFQIVFLDVSLTFTATQPFGPEVISNVTLSLSLTLSIKLSSLTK